MLNTNLLSAASGSQASSNGGGLIGMVIIYALVFAALYFFFIRPKSKKQKEEARMRESLDVGDEITTIGGIVGRIVSMRDEEDAIIVETGADKARIKLKKWAVSTIDNQKEEPKKTAPAKDDAEKPKRFFGRKKQKEDE